MFGRDLKLAMVKILSDPTKTLSDMEELLKDPSCKGRQKKSSSIMSLSWPADSGDIACRRKRWTKYWRDRRPQDRGDGRPEVKKWSLLYMVRLDTRV